MVGKCFESGTTSLLTRLVYFGDVWPRSGVGHLRSLLPASLPVDFGVRGPQMFPKVCDIRRHGNIFPKRGEISESRPVENPTGVAESVPMNGVQRKQVVRRRAATDAAAREEATFPNR